MTSNDEARSGLVFGLGATLLWGSYPLWYKPLHQLDAYHLLSWRIVFAEIFLLVLILVTGRFGKIRASLATTKLIHIFLVAAVLGVWWLMYIYGIMTGHVLQVAFGYFLSPLMSMAVSRLVFREPLSRLQASAIAMAALGVTLMAFELLSLESFPWIALVIGGCYSFYGIFKKKVPGDAVVIQSFEIMAMLPFAVIFLAVVHWQGHGYQFGVSGKTDYLLAATGLITVLPLWWYSLAAKKLPMVTLGFLQFVPPICNFLLAVFVYGEPVSTLKVVAFVAIWIALALFTLNSIGLQRAAALTLNAKTSGA